MEKPFYNLMWYSYRRSKWNPFYYILGEVGMTKNAKKAWRSMKFDATDIEILPQGNVDRAQAKIVEKVFQDWWSKNPQMSDNLKKYIEENYK